MSFAHDLAALTSHELVRCKTGLWVDSLDTSDRAVFDAHLANGGSVSHAWRAAVRNGCDAAETRFRVHCRRECCCYATEVAA